ncbi:hypothetical protein [Phenylobacterium sp. SCN 70-31]|uniref:hypothetical protein n=1 Tax=Phenylobacterium sp. SCN 70-31 TaxID=1660129 RepID=UPI000869B72C|nr:hypothetical protein [Phenylobacterium sp. SCN 70-31]ODT85246.1 MAG: hypothetical protein ABS78_21165 [Phenylobacterium sp. SCN 70-31]
MLKSLVAAVLSALVLFGGGPASAQTSEAETVGIELARTLFRAISFEALIAKEVGGAGNPFGDVPSRPEWTGYLIDALREEIAHDLPVFEGRFGRTLAKEFSLAELRVGLVILSDPMMQAAMRAGSESDGAAEPQGQPSREIRRALARPEGVAFMNKLERLDRYLEPLQDDLAAELLPGALRRFADKVDAGEAARRERAASGP